jgi:beta-glucosidase
VTLYHWDLPQVLEDAGGWPERDAAYRFAEYSGRVFARLGDRVSHWTTLNEPFCAGLLSYAAGVLAPGRHEPIAGIRAVHHLLLGHGLALEALRRSSAPHHQFGLTLNLSPVSAATSSEEDIDAARRIDALSNRLFLDPVLAGSYPADLISDLEPLTGFDHVLDGDLHHIGQPIDLLGVNYYTTSLVKAGAGHKYHNTGYVGAGDVDFVPAGHPTTARGWEIDPDGLYELLMRLSHDYQTPPMWITENGAACDDRPDADGAVHDPDRIAYLDSHFRAAHRAIRDGVDLRGYFVWTLLDNFEWSFGESSRFGLVHVDYDTQRRIPKDSAHWFAQVTARNGLEATPS